MELGLWRTIYAPTSWGAFRIVVGFVVGGVQHHPPSRTSPTSPPHHPTTLLPQPENQPATQASHPNDYDRVQHRPRNTNWADAMQQIQEEHRDPLAARYVRFRARLLHIVDQFTADLPPLPAQQHSPTIDPPPPPTPLPPPPPYHTLPLNNSPKAAHRHRRW